MAANLLVKRLSVQIEPSPWGPWTVSTNLHLLLVCIVKKIVESAYP